MRRRDFNHTLAGAGAAALAIGLAPRAFAQQEDEDYNSAILDSVLGELEEIAGQRIDAVGRSEIASPDRSTLRINGTDAGFPVPPMTAELRAELEARNYWTLPDAEKERLRPTWPARAPDYHHLAGFPLSSTQFQLSAGVLNTLAARNHFLIDDRRPVLIFGLRGCKLANGAKSAPWSLTHDLQAIDPTHLATRCVIGVLRKSNGMIALFQASTVPAVAAVYKSMGLANGAGTSVLPTGFYAYRIGDHRAAYPTRIQRSALLIHGQYCVLRTTDDLTYDAFSEGDAWTRGGFHNIHAGGASTERYNSNGCQVIEGGYTGSARRIASGPWSEFRAAAGLVDADGGPLPAETRPSYQYMLLTGREAALAYQGGAAFNNAYWRLRPGSSGEDVRDLQQRLFRDYTGIAGARVDGDFGMLTAFALLLHKKETEREFTSPIYLA